MFRRSICFFLVILLLPLSALAEEAPSGILTYDELMVFARELRESMDGMELLNSPGQSVTENGYAFAYDGTTLYLSTPGISEETRLMGFVITSPEGAGIRGVHVGDSAEKLLAAFENRNPSLQGSRTAAILYLDGSLPESTAWSRAERDGQRLRTVQYAVHSRMADGLYSDCGLLFTLDRDSILAIRAYGLDSTCSMDAVRETLNLVSGQDTAGTYSAVPRSLTGIDLEPFGEADLSFSGMDFLSLTPTSLQALLGNAVYAEWIPDGNMELLNQAYDECDATFICAPNQTDARIVSLTFRTDALEGPRALRLGDSFASVYQRFRHGEQPWDGEGAEILYGDPQGTSFGQAEYGTDATITLRYGFRTAQGRLVTLFCFFEQMYLTEMILSAD